jgi:phage shock protein A
LKGRMRAALDAAEDPSESLDLPYEQQVQQLRKVRRGIADVASAKNRLRSKVASLRKTSFEWGAHDEEAPTAKHDDSARLALSRQIEAVRSLLNLLLAIENLEGQQEQLQAGEQRLVAKIEAYRITHPTILPEDGADQEEEDEHSPPGGSGDPRS